MEELERSSQSENELIKRRGPRKRSNSLDFGTPNRKIVFRSRRSLRSISSRARSEAALDREIMTSLNAIPYSSMGRSRSAPRMRLTANSSQAVSRLMQNHAHQQDNQSAIRYVLSFMGCVGLCLVYALRVNQNIAIIAMTDKNSTLPNHKIYNWTENEKNAIIASFSYGYVSSQVVGGYLADKFNLASTVLGVGVLGTSILTSFVPIMADVSTFGLCVLRCIIGVFEGVTFPAVTSFWGKWAPPNERTRLLSWSVNGASLGAVFGSIITGFLATIPGLGWQASFYGFAFLGMIWCWLWFIISSDTPGDNDWIDLDELDHIENSLRRYSRERTPSNRSRAQTASGHAYDSKKVPYRDVFSSLPFYALLISHFCHGWCLYSFLNELPLFCNEVLGLGPATTSIFTSIPAFTSWLTGLIFPAFVDELIKKHDRNVIRKTIQGIAFFGPALVMILFTSIKNLPTWLMLILFILAQGMITFTIGGINCTHLDMAPKYCGTLFALTNSVANTAGFLVPLVTGYLTNQESSRETWNYVWDIYIGVSCFGGLVYIIFCDCNQQPWAEVQGQSGWREYRTLSNQLGTDQEEIESLLGSNNNTSVTADSDEELLPVSDPILGDALIETQNCCKSKSSAKSSSKSNFGQSSSQIVGSNIRATPLSAEAPISELVTSGRNNSDGSFLDVDIAVNFKSILLNRVDTNNT